MAGGGIVGVFDGWLVVVLLGCLRDGRLVVVLLGCLRDGWW